MATAPILPPAGPAGGGAPAPAPVPVIRNWGLNGWYALVYVGVFAVITIPVLLAAVINLAGAQWGNWYVLAVVTAAIDFPILFYPWPAIGLSIAEVIRRLRDRSPEDTVTMPRVYRLIVISILATRLAIVVLAILPVARNGASIAVFLGLIGMVWIGNLIYSKSTWFVERVWHFYLVLLIGAVAYWVVVTIWPDLRHSAAKSAANQTEQAILDQNEGWLKDEQTRIEGLLLKMPRNLSPAERVQRLTEADQATWAKIEKASFASKTTDKLSSKLSGASSAASDVFDWIRIKTKPSSTPSTAAGEVNKTSTDAPAASKPAATPAPSPTPAAPTTKVVWQGDYVPSQMRMVSLGSLTGRYRVTCDGSRSQTFFYGSSTPSQEFVMDCQGGYRATKAANGMPIQASPPRVNVYSGDHRPDSTRPYGEIIAMVRSQPVAIAQGQCNDVNGEVQFGLNIRDKDYQHTTGVLSVKAESC